MAQPLTEAEYIALHVAGRFPNDDRSAHVAVSHFRWVMANGGYTTPQERLVCVKAKKNLTRTRAKVPRCQGGCGKAMPKGVTCYWCKRGAEQRKDTVDANDPKDTRDCTTARLTDVKSGVRRQPTMDELRARKAELKRSKRQRQGAR